MTATTAFVCVIIALLSSTNTTSATATPTAALIPNGSHIASSSTSRRISVFACSKNDNNINDVQDSSKRQIFKIFATTATLSLIPTATTTALLQSSNFGWWSLIRPASALDTDDGISTQLSKGDATTTTTTTTQSMNNNNECDETCREERKKIIEQRRAMLRQSKSSTSRQDVFDLSKQRAKLYGSDYRGANCAPGIPCL
uniref:PSI-F n=1 Tax=Ditylum brightwellii TaxID=49249 RepID=A0A7S4QY27_9STRA